MQSSFPFVHDPAGAVTPFPWPECLRALTLTQPWATLAMLARSPGSDVAEKEFETRSFVTHLRQIIVIHASANFPRWARRLCAEEPFQSVLRKHGFNEDSLPLGKFLGTVELRNCEPVGLVVPRIDSKEFAFGNYEAGRFAYQLARPAVLPDPIAWSGLQRFWRVPGEPASQIRSTINSSNARSTSI